MQLIAIGYRIAMAYPARLPTVDELKREYRVSRATAYRWLAALGGGETSSTRGEERHA